MDIGDAFEAGGEPLAHFFPADETPAPRIRPARRLEHAVLGEVGHDRIEIMAVEGFEHSFSASSLRWWLSMSGLLSERARITCGRIDPHRRAAECRFARRPGLGEALVFRSAG
jgi:hypothetical protein